MKIAVMQPYFFPYIGYFQLMASVDRFVLFDNVQYIRQGWINRNRILLNGKPSVITLPLKKDSRFKHINSRQISDTFSHTKLLNQLREAYRHAPYQEEVLPLVEKILNRKSENLFDYLLHSLNVLRDALTLNCEILISSDIPINHDLRAQDKILAICKELDAHTYINLPGGRALYDVEAFEQHGVSLCFLQPETFHYQQLTDEFVPWLSIIDVMMFNHREVVSRLCRERWVLN